MQKSDAAWPKYGIAVGYNSWLGRDVLWPLSDMYLSYLTEQIGQMLNVLCQFVITFLDNNYPPNLKKKTIERHN